jgi:hypothetical protein
MFANICASHITVPESIVTIPAKGSKTNGINAIIPTINVPNIIQGINGRTIILDRGAITESLPI